VRTTDEIIVLFILVHVPFSVSTNNVVRFKVLTSMPNTIRRDDKQTQSISILNKIEFGNRCDTEHIFLLFISLALSFP